AVLHKYWTIFTLCLTERLTYRTDFLLGTLIRFLPIVTTVFLWKAVFDGSDQKEIAGFTADEMVAYYLLVLIARAFSSMPGLAGGVAGDVREGHIKKFLLQPVDLLGFLLVSRVAHKLVYYAVASLPLAAVFYFCSSYFQTSPPPHVWAAFLLSLVFAFLIGFLLETMIGLTAFWTLEVTSLAYITMTAVYILSGHMFPLDLLTGYEHETYGRIFAFLQYQPFQYLAYFPAKLFLHGERWTPWELYGAMAAEAATVAVLWVAARAMYRNGLRRYSAFGG
ncbi:MAG: ABC transporter permease, partial [Planctomycetia bacterium]